MDTFIARNLRELVQCEIEWRITNHALAGGVHQQGGLVHVTCEHGRVCLERMGNAVFDQRALSGAGFLSTQLATSDFSPGWPIPMRRRQ